MKTLLLALTLMFSTISFAYEQSQNQQQTDRPLQQQQCNTYCTEIAGSTTCQTVCS